MSKRKRIIGTTDDAIDRTEAQLGRKLPASVREWYLKHNGSGALAPVRDERDPRTWSGLLELREQFADLVENTELAPDVVEQLVPIMDPSSVSDRHARLHVCARSRTRLITPTARAATDGSIP